ncbi:RICIN domain-containing protein [Kitasatospora sp. NPDC059327]|uniref:RICIN domain-containing protein n=1 Tax=Kitasatospora sp. NPDC059327 TaxID=3346803 RepID=UPI00367F5549
MGFQTDLNSDGLPIPTPPTRALLNTWWSTHTSEQWNFAPNPDGTVRITDNCYTGTQNHGTLTGGPAGAPARVRNAYDPGEPAQKWYVVQDTATGALTVTNVATGLVLAAPQAAAGSPVVLGRADGSAAGQSWSLLS